MLALNIARTFQWEFPTLLTVLAAAQGAEALFTFILKRKMKTFVNIIRTPQRCVLIL